MIYITTMGRNSLHICRQMVWLKVLFILQQWRETLYFNTFLLASDSGFKSDLYYSNWEKFFIVTVFLQVTVASSLILYYSNWQKFLYLTPLLKSAKGNLITRNNINKQNIVMQHYHYLKKMWWQPWLSQEKYHSYLHFHPHSQNDGCQSNKTGCHDCDENSDQKQEWLRVLLGQPTMSLCFYSQIFADFESGLHIHTHLKEKKCSKK